MASDGATRVLLDGLGRYWPPSDSSMPTSGRKTGPGEASGLRSEVLPTPTKRTACFSMGRLGALDATESLKGHVVGAVERDEDERRHPFDANSIPGGMLHGCRRLVFGHHVPPRNRFSPPYRRR